ncbi:AraC family transcriptional regulator [Lederbergia galactosidilytica]|uniref:HTH araC/xylS-type domain-containing protein n=1 Tax=Lederbergia galactosidilytica TaxID=217031 RepID=A0A0Q9XVL3_9BACI|nr:AraC family transcriptional regulator [Lederbergia galactosidilytica]KRG12800.1 hypothetical protein ACA29_10285 [Lederbergia galactosidilytica]KRG14443.1 hypothetical protein ACA30_10715 [Virgibacillus soli]MBP1914973.1 AraC-like DNA-binding protein [Lederbergia galactosidilytica]OAK74251.1 hypothetical protein ABB05_05050 [Lederbergia galactosidilytica]
MTLKKIPLPHWGAYLYESRHKAGDLVKIHHHDIHQILYAIEGDGIILIDDQKHKIAKDQGTFLAPYTSHSIFSQTSLTLLVLAFDIHSLKDFGDHKLNNQFFKSSRFFTPDLIASSELRQQLRKMLYEQTTDDPLSSWALKIHLLHILLTLIRLAERTRILDKNSLRTETIKSYIDTHYYEPLTANDIADKLGISVRYVNTIFKESYQKTPMQYLMEIRIERAKKLLRETDKEIITICFEVGYETLSTFYRTFKNETNLSPKQYRDLGQSEA